jgi:hypothetical protein
MSEKIKHEQEQEEGVLDLSHEEQRMDNDRDFWSESVIYLLEEGMTPARVKVAIDGADLLLEARRERFPG